MVVKLIQDKRLKKLLEVGLKQNSDDFKCTEINYCRRMANIL